MKYYSLIMSKKNEITPFAGTWMDLSVILVSQTRKVPHDSPYMESKKK